MEGKRMSKEKQFKSIIAQYCQKKPDEIDNGMRFREDLGFSSLDFMSFLGEIEDAFDIELDEEDAVRVFTVGEALDLLESA
jgi:acyl carrier protein